MRELGYHLGLVEKTLCQLLCVAASAHLFQDFERTNAFDTGLAGERHEDVTHAPLAEFFEQNETWPEAARIAGPGSRRVRTTQVQPVAIIQRSHAKQAKLRRKILGVFPHQKLESRDDLLLDEVQGYFDSIWRGAPCALCKLRPTCPRPLDS